MVDNPLLNIHDLIYAASVLYWLILLGFNLFLIINYYVVDISNKCSEFDRISAIS